VTITLQNVPVADVPGCLVFRPDGTLEHYPETSREAVLRILEPRGEDWGVVEEGRLPLSGATFYSSRLAELHSAENPIFTRWMGYPVYGPVALVTLTETENEKP